MKAQNLEENVDLPIAVWVAVQTARPELLRTIKLPLSESEQRQVLSLMGQLIERAEAQRQKNERLVIRIKQLVQNIEGAVGKLSELSYEGEHDDKT